MDCNTVHFPYTLVYLDVIWQRIHLASGQLQHSTFPAVGSLLLLDNDELLFGKSLLLTNLLQNLL